MARVVARLLSVLVTGIVAALLGAGVAAACSCAFASIEEQVEFADVVARVVVEDIDGPANPSSSADPVTYTVAASAVWKGDVQSRFTFTSALSGVSCGLEGIQQGQDLLLFATVEGDALTSSMCSGTAVATEEQVAALSELLGDPAAPVGGAAVPEVTGSGGGWLLPAGIAVVAGLGVAAVYVRRRLPARDDDAED